MHFSQSPCPVSASIGLLLLRGVDRDLHDLQARRKQSSQKAPLLTTPFARWIGFKLTVQNTTRDW